MADSRGLLDASTPLACNLEQYSDSVPTVPAPRRAARGRLEPVAATKQQRDELEEPGLLPLLSCWGGQEVFGSH